MVRCRMPHSPHCKTLGNELIVDLTVTIAFYNAVVRVLATLQIDVEDDYIPYLRQFPLPG